MYSPSPKSRLQREIWNQNGVFIDERRGGILSKKWRKMETKHHNSRLKKVKAAIDNNSKSDAHLKRLTNNSKKVYFHKSRMTHIDKENELLMRRMLEINKNGSGINTGLIHSKSQQIPLENEKGMNFQRRKLHLQKILKENKEILKLIQAQKTVYPIEALNKDWKHNKRLISNMSITGSPNKSLKRKIKSRNQSISKSRFKTDRNSTWTNLNSINTGENNNKDLNSLEMDDTENLLPKIRKMSVAQNTTREISHSPDRLVPLNRRKHSASKNSIIQHFKNPKLKDGRLVVHKKG